MAVVFRNVMSETRATCRQAATGIQMFLSPKKDHNLNVTHDR